MNIKNLLLAFFITLLFTSCSHVYTPALYHQDIIYQPKPSSSDSVKAATYVSAGYNDYGNSNLSDGLQSGELDISRGLYHKRFNLAYGAFGVFGDYENYSIKPTQANYFTDKYFGAVGARASANLLYTEGNTDYRYLGVEVAYSHEYGAYANFRQYLNTQPQQGYYVDPTTNLFTLGLTTEILIHSRSNKFRQGFRLFVGTTLDYNNLSDKYYYNKNLSQPDLPHGLQNGQHKFFPKATYFIKFKNYFGTIEGVDGFFVRLGYQF